MPADTDPHDEDDALHWDGDDDAKAVLPQGWHAKGKGADRVVSASPDDTGRSRDEGGAGDEGRSHAGADAEPEALGNAGLIGLGVLGGVYLLFTIGWVVGGLRLQHETSVMGLEGPAASVPAVWLAVLAPAIWFVTTLWLTRRSRTWLRFVWLVAGAVLLVPWPFALLGGVGQ
jgi:hypothetical protein